MFKLSGVLRPDWPAPANVSALYTERDCCGQQDFNLAAHVGDDPQRVAGNRALLMDALGTVDRIQWLNQVHGNHVVEAGTDQLPDADGVFTASPALACAILTADCMPVLFCDEDGTRVAAAHAGWRGLCSGVLANALAAFPDPARVLVWLGPAIGPEHFEVGAEVRAEFLAEFGGVSDRVIDTAFTPLPESDGKYLCNLGMLATAQLKGFGVNRIYGGEWCTVNQNARFFSHRLNAPTGRNAALIWLHKH